MAQLQNGQQLPLQAALSGTDTEGNTIEFKEDENNKGTWTGEDKDYRYVITKQAPELVNVSAVKKTDDKKPKINDPYYQRIEANRPKAKAEGAETTEQRETKEFGKAAKRTDVETGKQLK
jgi:hypothetical protein